MLDRYQNKTILFGLSAFGLWARAPELFSSPRFWAEEGARYFPYALEHGFWSALMFLDPRAGYLDVTRNLSAGLASLVPLAYAPYVTTYIAYVVQLIACFIIIYGRSLIFDNYGRKLLACIIVIFAPSVLAEVWLNTINSMTWFGLIGFLILIDQVSLLSHRKVIFYRVVLAVGALSGPYVCMLTPIYWLIALRDKTRDTMINASILLCGLAIHGVILVYYLFSGVLNEKRFHSIDLIDALDSIFWNHIARPIFGSEYPVRVLLDFISAPYIGKRFVVVLLLIILVGAAIFQLIHKRSYRFTYTPAFFTAASWFLISIGTTIASYNNNPVGRYAVLPGWIVLFFLLNFTRPFRLKFAGVVFSCLLVPALGIGLMSYSLGKPVLCDGRNWRQGVQFLVAGREATKTGENGSIHETGSVRPYKVKICPSGLYVELPTI